jgi:hypothetical protein
MALLSSSALSAAAKPKPTVNLRQMLGGAPNPGVAEAALEKRIAAALQELQQEFQVFVKGDAWFVL